MRENLLKLPLGRQLFWSGMSENFGDRLRAARKAQNFTKAQMIRLLSDQAGFSVNRETYAAWELIGTPLERKLRSYPHPNAYAYMGKILQVSPAWLVFGDPTKAPRDPKMTDDLIATFNLLPDKTKKIVVELLKRLR